MDTSLEIEEAAATWLARREGDRWTDADAWALQQWLDQATAHRVAFLRLEAAWRQTSRLKVLAAGGTQSGPPAVGAWQQSPYAERVHNAPDWPPGFAAPEDTRTPDETFTSSPASDSATAAEIGPAARPVSVVSPSRTSQIARACAAALALLLMGGLTVWWTELRGADYRTAVGGLASVPMTDGSRVTLNTDSEMRVRVLDSERRVQLAQGEAYFEVAKDPKRPFVVTAGDESVTAVGTKFSVRRVGDEIQVVVTEGRVRIERHELWHQTLQGTLDAGQVARAGPNAGLRNQRAIADEAQYLGWRSGYLTFHDATLGDAVNELNRYNTYKLVVVDPAVGAIQIGGSFKANNIEAFLRLLSQGFGVRVQRFEDQAVLSGS
jgi:transmembrane sensor